MPGWNLWHGCHKISEGCRNCYVYRTDEKYGRDASAVGKTKAFSLPIQRKRSGEYKIPPGQTLDTCFTSDFFLEDADRWRAEAWSMIRERSDLNFFTITKRIDRFYVSLPEDWGEGYENVTICCTVENQDRADYRLPLFQRVPIRHKCIVCSPLLGPIDLRPYLGQWVELVSVGGESGEEARVCSYDWVLDLHRQCVEAGISFQFHQTGARLQKDGRIYRIQRKYQFSQAKKAGLNYSAPAQP